MIPCAESAFADAVDGFQEMLRVEIALRIYALLADGPVKVDAEGQEAIKAEVVAKFPSDEDFNRFDI